MVWNHRIGKLVRFTALQEGANVSMLLFHARDLTERYNMPDSLKAQYTAHLTKGNVLMSDNGRILASFVEDSLGWHDTISRLHNAGSRRMPNMARPPIKSCEMTGCEADKRILPSS